MPTTNDPIHLTSARLPLEGEFFYSSKGIIQTEKYTQELPMFACAIILLLFSPAIFMLIALETHFSAAEMEEMGICLKNLHS